MAVDLGLGRCLRAASVPALIFGVAVGNVLQGVPFHLTQDLYPMYDGSFHAKFLGLLNPFRAAGGRGVAGDAADPWRGLAGAQVRGRDRGARAPDRHGHGG